jgi:hypothetical protein
MSLRRIGRLDVRLPAASPLLTCPPNRGAWSLMCLANRRVEKQDNYQPVGIQAAVKLGVASNDGPVDPLDVSLSELLKPYRDAVEQLS